MNFFKIYGYTIALSIIFSLPAAPKRDSGQLPSSYVEGIEKTFQKEATLFPAENSARIVIPRDEIVCTIQNIPIDPFLGFSTLLFFKKGVKPGVQLMAMGDIIMTEEEIQPVINSGLNNKVNLSALHNHFLYENPKFYFIHFDIEGDANTVINAVKQMIDALQKAKKPTLTRAKKPSSSLDVKKLQPILGDPAESKDGMHKFVVNRPFQASCGCIVGKGMGVASWAAFQGSDDNAIMIGDFALLETEVQNVLKALNKTGIKIFAIHNHMLEEKPRFISVHFMGKGTSQKLAQGFKLALDQTNPEEPSFQKPMSPSKSVRPEPNSKFIG